MLITGKITVAGLNGNAAGVAQRLAGGDLRGALALLPGMDAAALLALYGQAFGWLLVLLAGITTITRLLGRESRIEAPALRLIGWRLPEHRCE